MYALHTPKLALAGTYIHRPILPTLTLGAAAARWQAASLLGEI